MVASGLEDAVGVSQEALDTRIVFAGERSADVQFHVRTQRHPIPAGLPHEGRGCGCVLRVSKEDLSVYRLL